MVEFASCEGPQVEDDTESDDVVRGDARSEDPGDTDTIEADVEGQAWLGFDDADGNCAAFEVWLEYDTPVAVTITGFAGTWSWQTLSCE